MDGVPVLIPFTSFLNSVLLMDKPCKFMLKVQSCKLCNNKCMSASTQIKNTEIFAFTAVLVFKLLSRKVLFINKTYNRNC